MIKIFTFRRITIVSLLLLLAIILYSYPEEINENVVPDNACDTINIYLVNPNDYVVMSSIKSPIDFDSKIIAILDSLKFGNDSLRGVFSKDIKLLDYSLDQGLLKLNFNESFYNVNLENEELMIQSLIYSFTALEEVDRIMIFVNGKRLLELPNSHKKLDLYLDRSYGVNKVFEITTFVDTKMITVYYPTEFDYYVPVSYIVNDSEDKINIIVKYAKTNKFNNTNLSSHLDYQVELINYEANENEVFLNFNDVLLSSIYDGELKEEVKYALSYSIFDTLNVENVVFSVNSVKIDEFRLAN